MNHQLNIIRCFLNIPCQIIDVYYAEGNTIFDKSYCENIAMILQVFSKYLCTKNNKREVDNCMKCTKEFSCDISIQLKAL